MIPYKYYIKDGITHFKYHSKELKAWYKRGIEFGDCGLILIERDGDMFKYQAFGTIDNPSKSEKYITIKHFPPMDGKMKTDDEQLIKPKPFFTKENTKMYIIDFSEGKIEEFK